MNKPRHKKRQVYNKKALEKASQKQQTRTKTGKPSRNIAKEIINEIEGNNKEVNEIKEEIDNTNNKEDNNNPSQTKLEPPKGTTSQKVKKSRLKLDEKTLLYNENGLKKYYDTITNTQFTSSNDQNNLNKLVNLFRNWHFLLFPSYDMNYFTSRLIALGEKAPTKSYMSRLRRIYKGEETWDVMYNEQNLILGKGTIMNEHIVNPYSSQKEVVKESESKTNKIKIDDIEIDENILEDLVLENFGDNGNNKIENKQEPNNEIDNIEDLEKDYDNISFNYDNEDDNVDLTGQKRNYQQALQTFGTTIEENNEIKQNLHEKLYKDK